MSPNTFKFELNYMALARAAKRLPPRELAPLYSMTSSARSRIDVGSSMPIALAVLRFTHGFKLRGLLHRQLGGLRPLENFSAT